MPSPSGLESATVPVERSVARPARPRIKRQFSLATLLIIVLWLASGYSIWFYWQPWVLVGEYESIQNQLWYSQDGSKLLSIKGDSPGEINVRTGAVVSRPDLNPPLSWWWRPSDTWDWVVCDRSDPFGKHCAIEIHNLRSGGLEQTLEGSGFSVEGHFSADGVRLFNSGNGGSIDAYRWKENTLEWRIKPLREEQNYEDPPSPALKETAEEEKRRRVCERNVCAAQSLSDLTERVEKLAGLPLGPSRMDVRLSPHADLAVTMVSTKDAARAFSWNLVKGTRNGELEGFLSNEQRSLEFSEDGCFLGAIDTAGCKAVVWDLATGRLIASWKIPDTPIGEVGLYLARDARMAATQSEAGIRLWECSTGRLLSELPSLEKLAFFPDARRVAGVIRQDESASLELFDTETGAHLCTLTAPAMDCGGSVTCAPDGRSLAVVGATPGGATARVYWCNHPETAHGWLAMPVAWVFIALSLLIVWRTVRRARLA